MSILWLDRLNRAGGDLFAGLRQLVYPGCCLLCGQPLPVEQAHFCFSCLDEVFVDHWYTCPRCAGTIGPFAAVATGCPACRNEKFAFERVVRLGAYEGLLREVILRLKHQTGEGLAELLGEYWAEKAKVLLDELHADAVVPVPLHWLRRWRRGYNQSAALAAALAKRLHLPCHPTWLRRIRNTPRQTYQTLAARKTNVKGAFRARRGVSLAGRAILLVDDVMTTGATVGEAAKELRDAGAARIVVAVLARAQG